MSNHTTRYEPTQEDWSDYASYADARDRDYDRATDARFAAWVDSMETRGSAPRLADLLDMQEAA